jgi:preprotein translocase subunit SecY
MVFPGRPTAAARLFRKRLQGSLSVGRATNHLWRRIWLTLGVLVVYRLGMHIPIPGIDPHILADVFRPQLRTHHMFFPVYIPWDSMAIFTLGIVPYISAAVILQLMATVSPRLAALMQDGGAGRRKIDRYARYGAVLLSIFLSYGIAVDLESRVAVEPGPWFRVTTVLTMTGGVILLMWLAGQIDRRGIGPGAFVILACPIAADLPQVVEILWETYPLRLFDKVFVPGLLLLLLVVAASSVLSCAHRPLLLHYPEQEQNTGIIEPGAKTAAPFIPLCVAGLGPVVLAAMLVMALPGIAFIDLWRLPLFHLGPPVNFNAAAVLVFVLTLLLATAAADSAGLAAALRDRGATVPGVRPGEDTAAHFDAVVRRLAPLAGLLMALVVVLPEVFISRYRIPWASSGVSLMILTFVMLAVVRQIRELLDPGTPPTRHGSSVALWPAAWPWPDLDGEPQEKRALAGAKDQ